ncbi:hypothetical protein [Stenotrophomonas sp.]|uniref:hypothetical protein n=1 Tax=Stenotrophomonas sp. TaxID=69392 RepID=UPI0028973750|nr:hypothetical protein [Stenotrophomonas sp.]
MNKLALFALIGAVALSGCAKKEVAVAPEADSGTEQAVQTPVGPAESPGDAVLIGGYKPTFVHDVRSERHEVEPDGRTHHVMIVAANGLDQEGVIAALSADAERNKLIFTEAESTDTSVRKFTLGSADVERMTVGVNKPDEKGRTIVYFGWRDTSTPKASAP